MEDRLVFDSRYRVGVEQLDREHQGLFEIASRIYDSLSLDVIVPMHEIRSAINELIESTGSHFANEEMLMETSGYPNLEEHRALHAGLISSIRKLGSQAEMADRLTPVDLYEFLCDWLGDHILTSDRMFGEFMAQQGASRRT